ncbi:beta-xylosidase [Paenibacillus oryzae]|uniref:Beta-xylosidase n=1 Tax=Paenibacillus oryzae TaxID=1844972 RepID=A0A1A5YJL6_9BACL|nr:glycoside hydrolase family 52 protein [Paenibacillus oryzae]OBR65794.1 beta-xylosidase [Paenibacillus oryzae]
MDKWQNARKHHKTPFFNAHHSPIGAFSSFTVGFPGASGGFDIERAQPPKENIYIALEEENGRYAAFPFFEESEDESKRYESEQEHDDGSAHSTGQLRSHRESEISRYFGPGSDTWKAGDLTFTLYSQVCPVPDPASGDEKALKLAVVPAILAELTVDNTAGKKARKAWFGYGGSDPYSVMRRINSVDDKMVGVGQGRFSAIVTQDAGIIAAQHFSIDKLIENEHEENYQFGLGKVGALLMETPAGEKRTYRFALCFFRDGIVTTGIDASYWYTRYFGSIEEVGAYALNHFDEIKATSQKADEMLDKADLSHDQRFMMAHAIRSYYGCTQFLDWKGQPLWNVNEGEYRMINTFDLTVDQLFYEIRTNPWTVKNELELYAERYSYRDEVRFPGDETLHPGGISFTHDMGVGNDFSRPGYSCYEQAGLDGCFSYMTHEQLVNWVLCAAVYVNHTGDNDWLAKRLPLLEECLVSMMNRDNPDPAKRNGIMGLDSSRCKGGAEITTYDSLDQSLGQARNNSYLASKCWAAYIALEKILGDNGRAELAAAAGRQSELCAASIASYMTEGGYIPGVVGENNDSRIIPSIEGLVFPYAFGCPEALERNGRYGDYIQALSKHLGTVLTEGICLFPNGAWKLSSTSNNSWLSKIYLCQFVARHILDLAWDEKGRKADEAHVSWLLAPQNAFWSWSDQILSGTAVGSKYYPRGVTSILWLDEKQAQ